MFFFFQKWRRDKTGPLGVSTNHREEDIKKSVKKTGCSGNIMYTCMKMEK
jgi:hypothetical protein